MNKHDEYVERCKEKNMLLMKSPYFKVVIKHKRKNGQKVGTVVAFRNVNESSIYLGVSKCRKGDKFEKHLGIKLAIERAVKVSVRAIKSNKLTKALLAATPLSMMTEVENVVKTLSRRKSFVG